MAQRVSGRTSLSCLGLRSRARLCAGLIGAPLSVAGQGFAPAATPVFNVSESASSISLSQRIHAEAPPSASR